MDWLTVFLVQGSTLESSMSSHTGKEKRGRSGWQADKRAGLAFGLVRVGYLIGRGSRGPLRCVRSSLQGLPGVSHGEFKTVQHPRMPEEPESQTRDGREARCNCPCRRGTVN